MKIAIRGATSFQKASPTSWYVWFPPLFGKEEETRLEEDLHRAMRDPAIQSRYQLKYEVVKRKFAFVKVQIFAYTLDEPLDLMLTQVEDDLGLFPTEV